jgi:PAS domain S-box-containing protein
VIKRTRNLQIDEAKIKRDTQGISDIFVGFEHPIFGDVQCEDVEYQLYASAIKNMQTGLYIWRLERTGHLRTFKLVAANHATERFSGTPAKDLLGKTMKEAFPALDKRVAKIGGEIICSGKAMDLGEFRYCDERVPEGVFSVKAFPLPNSCVGVTLEDVTERKKAELALSDSEHCLRSVANSAADAVISVNAKGKIVFWNKAAERIFGHTAHEAVGKSVTIIVPHQFATAHQKGFEQLLSSKRPTTNRIFDFVGLKRDGTEFPAEASLSSWKMRQETFFTIIARDITEQKHMEQTMKQSEEKYRNVSQKLTSLMKSSATMLHTTDLRERLRTIAEAVREQGWARVVISLRDENLNTTDVVTAGLTPEEEQYLREHQSPGHVWRKRLSSMFERFCLGEFYYLPWSDPLVRKQFKYALASKVPKEDTIDWNPDDLLFVPLRLPTGQVVGIMSIDDPRDGRRPTMESLAPLELFAHQAAVAIENAKLIQQVKEYAQHLEEKVEERTRDLRKSEEKIRSIFAASPDAITATDLNGNIVECSEQTLRNHGYSSKRELIGQSAFKLIAEKDQQKAIENMRRTLNEGVIKNVEYTFVTKTGREFPAELTASVVFDASHNPTGFVAITKDITDRKRMEQQLFKSERLAAIGELAGMVGHDLRNPLTGIAGAAYYLKTKYGSKLDKTAREMLNIIGNDIEYSNKIINDLLEYSREVKLTQAETTPKAIIREALALARVPKNVWLIDLTRNEPRIKVDFDKMKRAFVNIIKNAVDAMPKGGTLTIKSKKAGRNVEFIFTDTGLGMPKEVAEKIFTPLFTTKAKGMGFGLPICRRHVDAHGGHITVQSELGKGTSFTVAIPIEAKLEKNEKLWIDLPESLIASNAHQKHR